MKIDGSCHCGAITYEAEIDPAEVFLCHCADCQTLSGSAFRVVVGAKPGTFRLLSGEPKVYIKTAESGRDRLQTFCGDCGSPLYSALPDPDAGFFGIRVGTIRQRDQLKPTSQYWCRSEQDWLGEIPAMARVERQ